jgi:uncharacterized protein YndB with AHSA1/START domain
MNPNLHFDFLVDKEKNTLTIQREFLADRQLVWDCYTKQELLDQWFGPEPLSTKTKSMEFKENGHWHYVMIEPNGTEYWGWTTYLSISPIDYYTSLDAFCNEKGEINETLPQAKWQVTFTDKGDRTMVETVVTYDALEDLETIIKMGMEEGMRSTLERLDKLLVARLNEH